MHSVIDLVMVHRNCPAYEAARWIGENWRVAGRVQIERSENAHGKERHTYQRYQPIPVPDKSEPSIQALVASPGWREMPLSTRVLTVTLFAMVETEDNRVVSISRRQLAKEAGIRKSNTIAQAVRELEAIGLFAVDRASWGNRGYKASSFKLTWWRQAFPAWLTQGYATPHTSSTHQPPSTSNSETFGTHPLAGQRQEPGQVIYRDLNAHQVDRGIVAILFEGQVA
jgi:hypothetical protein